MALGARNRILNKTHSKLPAPTPQDANIMRDKCQGRNLHCACHNQCRIELSTLTGQDPGCLPLGGDTIA